LKFKSSKIVEKIEERGFEVILSALGSYGACDIDITLLNEVDVLLHFGHTELLKMDRVICIPYFIDYELSSAIRIEERNIALIATVQYAWRLDEVKRKLEEEGYKVELRRGNLAMPGQVLGCNYSVLKDSKADAVLFIGDGLFHPLGAAIYTGKKVYRFSPLTNEFEEVKHDDFMKKRMNLIAKALYSESRGAIIISCKPGQKRIKLAKKLKKKAKKAGKKVDLIVVDEITPVKLSSFPYGYYVNTACPRISYDDAELFPVPILTPAEFEIMIGTRSWDDYRMDELDRKA
jgi:2-(3-amino-3-carboxypropyl)histidine synthase